MWRRVIRISQEFLKHKHVEIVRIICKRLRDIQCFEMAGEIYEDIGHFEEATKCYLNSNLFEKAKNCLDNIQDNEVQK